MSQSGRRFAATASGVEGHSPAFSQRRAAAVSLLRRSNAGLSDAILSGLGMWRGRFDWREGADRPRQGDFEVPWGRVIRRRQCTDRAVGIAVRLILRSRGEREGLGVIEEELAEAIAVEGGGDLVATLLGLLFGQDVADRVGRKRGDTRLPD